MQLSSDCFFFRLLLHTEDEAKTFRHPFGNLLKIRWARITYQNERNWLLKSNWQEIFRQFVRKRNKIAYSHCRKINHPHTDVCVVRSSWNVLFHFVVFFPNLAESFNSDLFCSILCTFFFLLFHCVCHSNVLLVHSDPFNFVRFSLKPIFT